MTDIRGRIVITVVETDTKRERLILCFVRVLTYSLVDSIESSPPDRMSKLRNQQEVWNNNHAIR